MHETFWNTEVFPNEIFRYCVTKSFRRRNLIPPFLMNIIFRYPNFCDTPKCSPTNIFGTARQKFFDGKYWYFRPPPPPLIHKLFRYQKISGKQKGSFTKLFVSVLWDKKILTKPWWPSPSYAWKFSIKEFFWNTKMFANEIFGYTETENRDTTPLIHKIFFPTRNFLKHRMVPWRGFFGPVR